nr:MAG TPA: hypothetical protein [Caudoviricetes sp.]
MSRATRSGAMMRTLLTSKVSSMRSLIAESVITVFP